jgi:hypothetical protein
MDSIEKARYERVAQMIMEIHNTGASTSFVSEVSFADVVYSLWCKIDRPLYELWKHDGNHEELLKLINDKMVELCLAAAVNDIKRL